MSVETLREYNHIKSCTPAELELAFQIMGFASESKNKKVVMLISNGGIDFVLACRILNTKISTARRTADRVERGLIRIEQLIKMRAGL